MNQINDPGNPKDFGLEFNYSAWSANNIFTLCNVPWNSDYRDVHGFATNAELDSYIDSTPSTTRVQIAGTRAKLNMPVKVGMTLAKAMKYNYMRVKNGLQPVETGDEPQTFYYFIVGMREIAPETTELLLQLDIWSSFRPSITGCRGFVERGHIGIANTKQMQNYGRDYLSVPEGFDTGSEYVGVAARNTLLIEPSSDDGAMDIVAVFASDPTANPYKTVDGKQVPNYTVAKGTAFQGLPSAADIRVWNNSGAFFNYLAQYTDEPWMLQSLISALIVPNLTRYFPGWLPSGINDGSAPPTQKPQTKTVAMYNNWRNSILTQILPRYRNLNKMLTAPYMLIELTAFAGTPINIRPENWRDANATVMERANLMPPNARVQIAPKAYNTVASPDLVSGAGFQDEDGGSNWDMFTQVTNFPAIPIVNDQAILALANQSNALSYAAKSADWSQQKSLTAAQTGYDQASSAMQLGSDQLLIQQQGAAAQNAIQQEQCADRLRSAGSSVVGGAAAGMALGGPAGGAAGVAGGIGNAIGNAAGALSNIQAMNESLVQNWDTQNAGNARQNEFGSYIRDSNADLARYAARGDYENSLAGIQASVRDTMMTPASVVGQTGGELINLVNGTLGYSLRWKMLDLASIRAIGEHWLRFGYAVQQFTKVPASFKVMSKFTYWKMSETYLQGARIPENFRQALRGILEKGVTVWTDPDDISNPDFDIADNTPLSGVTLP